MFVFQSCVQIIKDDRTDVNKTFLVINAYRRHSLDELAIFMELCSIKI